MVFSIVGGLLAAVIPIEIVHAFSDQKLGFRMMSLVFASVIFISPILMLIFIREKGQMQKEEKFSFLKGIKQVSKNRPFVFALLMFLFTYSAVVVISAMLMYYIKYYLKMESQASLIMGSIFVTAVIFLPVWYWISKRIGKKRTYTLSSLLIILVFILLFFVPPDGRFIVYILAFWGGVGISAAHLIPWSIMPDVVEYDELKTGKRREGMYSGFYSLLLQLAQAGALFLTGAVLEISGYVPDMDQTSSSLFAIKLLFCLIPAFLFFLGIISLSFYPITESVHRRIREILQKKRLRYDISPRQVIG
jgi:Na+/melibiose symporter-like transporter